MKTIIDKANTRGYFNHGWLKTYHTFSFADYYNPKTYTLRCFARIE